MDELGHTREVLDLRLIIHLLSLLMRCFHALLNSPHASLRFRRIVDAPNDEVLLSGR